MRDGEQVRYRCSTALHGRIARFRVVKIRCRCCMDAGMVPGSSSRSGRLVAMP